MDFELQFTPTRTASDEMKEGVRREFADAGIPVARWTIPAGEDKELPSGLKWADPTLEIRAIADTRASDALAGLPGQLAGVLSSLRRRWPTLGLSLQVKAEDRNVYLAVRLADGPDAWHSALQAIRTFELEEPNLYGWDSTDSRWIRI